jgi:hypothetical protein
VRQSVGIDESWLLSQTMQFLSVVDPAILRVAELVCRVSGESFATKTIYTSPHPYDAHGRLGRLRMRIKAGSSAPGSVDFGHGANGWVRMLQARTAALIRPSR